MTIVEALAVLGLDGVPSPDTLRRAYLRAVKSHRPERDGALARAGEQTAPPLEADAAAGAPPAPPSAGAEPAPPAATPDPDVAARARPLGPEPVNDR